MRISIHCILALLFFFGTDDLRAQDAVRFTDSSVSPPLYGALRQPVAGGQHPAVVLLHGSRGWRPEYAEFAQSLADSGFVALAIDYYSQAAPETSIERRQKLWRDWQASVRNAVAYLSHLPSVDSDAVALVGFSQGAYLAVSVAGSISSVKAVVDFFGGINTRVTSMEDQLRNFPPLLILHGEADTLVPVSRAYQLKQAVIDQGGRVEMHTYPGAMHAFNSKAYPWYHAGAAKDSFERMIAFLRRELQH